MRDNDVQAFRCEGNFSIVKVGISENATAICATVMEDIEAIIITRERAVSGPWELIVI